MIRILVTAALMGAPAAGLPVPTSAVPLSGPEQPRQASGPRSQAPGLGFRASRAGRVTVHHAPADSARAARLVRFLEIRSPLPALPDTLPRDVHVYLAPTAAAFDSLTGGRIPEWGAGVAVPARSRIVLPAYGGRNTRGREEARVLRHEWAHIGLHQYLEGHAVPRWFDEGYAEWASGGWDAREGWRLRLALAGGAAPAMDSLALRWPRERSSARLAYMLSGTALEYLVRRSGVRGLTLFLERWRRAGSFEPAFRSVYGVTLSQFEEDWREYVEDTYGWLFVLSHSVVFWLFLALVLLAMVWIRRRRNREAMARLRATEPAEEPAWWQRGGLRGRHPPREEPTQGRRGPIDGNSTGSRPPARE